MCRRRNFSSHTIDQNTATGSKTISEPVQHHLNVTRYQLPASIATCVTVYCARKAGLRSNSRTSDVDGTKQYNFDPVLHADSHQELDVVTSCMPIWDSDCTACTSFDFIQVCKAVNHAGCDEMRVHLRFPVNLSGGRPLASSSCAFTKFNGVD